MDIYGTYIFDQIHWNHSCSKGVSSLIARDMGAVIFYKFTLAFSNFFWRLSRQLENFEWCKTGNFDQNRLEEDGSINQQSNLFQPSLSFQLPKAIFFERPGFAPGAVNSTVCHP